MISRTEQGAGGLPPPEPEAARHSDRLTAVIRERMGARGGYLPFDEFMDLALYAPGLGYYVAGAQKFGAGGDFVTAPEISPLFSRCLANQCAEILGVLGGGDILELGPGSGLMACDILLRLDELDCLPDRYLLLELSPELRQRQRETVARRAPHLLQRLRWLEGLPAGLRGVVLANEVLDAMPVHRFQIGARGAVCEVCVRRTAGGWEDWVSPPVSPGLAEAVSRLQTRGLALETGFRSEINLRLRPWLTALGRSLERGAALLIDYGYPEAEYYGPDRSAGTLLCHYRHRAHPDPYWSVGLQDITAHVDFSAVAAAAAAAGLELGGYASQAHFLIGCGLDGLLRELDPTDAEAHLDAIQGAKRLVMPAHMGERFQVLGLTKSYPGSLAGFALRDLRDRL